MSSQLSALAYDYTLSLDSDRQATIFGYRVNWSNSAYYPFTGRELAALARMGDVHARNEIDRRKGL